jgi:hypothetical protein
MAETQKQRWADRADRYEAWASSAEEKAAALRDSRTDGETDHAFLTQPASAKSALGRARARLNNRDRAAWEMEKKAASYRDKASNLRAMASRNAGDAESSREVKRAALDAIISVGDIVNSIYGPRRVLKVNAKTYRIEGAFGPIAIDKALCRRISA